MCRIITCYVPPVITMLQWGLFYSGLFTGIQHLLSSDQLCFALELIITRGSRVLPKGQISWKSSLTKEARSFINVLKKLYFKFFVEECDAKAIEGTPRAPVAAHGHMPVFNNAILFKLFILLYL